MQRQRIRDFCEGRIQLGAEAVHDRDDRDRNASGNQAVFYGGSAGFILQKRDKLRHWWVPSLG